MKSTKSKKSIDKNNIATVEPSGIKEPATYTAGFVTYKVGKPIQINLSDLDQFNKDANEKLEKMIAQIRSKN